MIVAFIDRESPLGCQYTLCQERSGFYHDATFYSAGEIEKLLTAAGFSGFAYRQTLLPEEASWPTVQEGHGSGGFVVIRAHKTRGGSGL